MIVYRVKEEYIKRNDFVDIRDDLKEMLAGKLVWVEVIGNEVRVCLTEEVDIDIGEKL
jgi:hypothetical protein